jgi:hypothetical protein
MQIAVVCLALSMLVAAGAASAELVLYEHDNYNGRSFRAENSVSNLGQEGINDMASSVKIRGGKWQLCEDAYFRGNCVTLNPGDYPSLNAFGINDKVSSARELGWTPDGGGGWSGGSGNNDYNNHYNNSNNNWTGGGNWGSGSRAVLFEGYNLSGRTFLVSPRGVSSLADVGFNDKASSLRVESGYWLFCSDAFFQGDCRTFGPGDYPSLPPGLNNKISSGRRVSTDYPYQQNPSWGN